MLQYVQREETTNYSAPSNTKRYRCTVLWMPTLHLSPSTGLSIIRENRLKYLQGKKDITHVSCLLVLTTGPKLSQDINGKIVLPFVVYGIL